MEIEQALDEQYHKWRRLVTHHDPQVVNRANQALQIVERMRTTLLNPQRRRSYDAALGVGEAVLGLADPDANVAAGSVASSSPAPPAKQSAGAARVDAWICPQCETPNTLGLRFCRDCGHRIGVECTKCGELVEAAAKFCAACGVNQETARYETEMLRLAQVRAQMEGLHARLTKERAVLSLLEEVARTGKRKFSDPKLKQLAVQHLPEVERVGCWEGLFYLTIFSVSILLIFVLLASVYLGSIEFLSQDNLGIVLLGVFILAVWPTVWTTTRVNRRRRKKSAKALLSGQRAQVAALEQEIQALQATLPVQA
jgi:hypothetical protein